MALNRPRKPSFDGPDGDGKPKGETFDLGLMKVTISKVGDLYNESAINLTIDSERLSLLQPVMGEVGQEPSAADKIIQLVKQSLREANMTVLENKGKPDEPRPPGMPENRIKLSLREFSAYKPGGSGVTIRAERGYYEGKFNSDAMLEVVGEGLRNLSGHLRSEPTVEKFEAHVDQIYNAVDMYNHTLAEATQDRPKPAQQNKPLPRLVESPEVQLTKLLNQKIPVSLMAGDDDAAKGAAQKDVVEKIFKGVLCAGEACWAKAKGDARGSTSDPLYEHVSAALTDKLKAEVTPAVKKFLIDEVCEAVYKFQDKAAGISTNAR